MAKSPYQILGVKPDATADQIRAAHRKLAIKFHPDRAKSKSQVSSLKSQKRMAEINGVRDALLKKDGSLKPQVSSFSFVHFQGNGADQVRMGLSILDAFVGAQSARKINDGIAELLDKLGHDDPATRQLVNELRRGSSPTARKGAKR